MLGPVGDIKMMLSDAIFSHNITLSIRSNHFHFQYSIKFSLSYEIDILLTNLQEAMETQKN